MVDIKGLNKADVLAALYNNSHPLGLGFLNAKPGRMTTEEAAALLAGPKTHAYFDYLHGRVMKIDLSNDDAFDEWGYDRDLGSGAAQRVIDELRAAVTV